MINIYTITSKSCRLAGPHYLVDVISSKGEDLGCCENSNIASSVDISEGFFAENTMSCQQISEQITPGTIILRLVHILSNRAQTHFRKLPHSQNRKQQTPTHAVKNVGSIS